LKDGVTDEGELDYAVLLSHVLDPGRP
jgi:hypothetical protein